MDLRKAYDKVQHSLLWQTLDLLGIQGELREAIHSLYRNAQLAVKVNGRAGVSMHPDIGVKQGCPLSPTLFGLVFDALEKHLEAAVPGVGAQLAAGLTISLLLYADDVVLLADSAEGLQALIDSMHAF